MITDLLLPVGLAVIMAAMGLTLTPGDFRVVVTRPRALLVGLFCQMVALPLVALAVVLIFRPEPDFAVGLMILAACPGGITSNLLTHLAGGATALAVSLTALTSVAGVVSVPVVVNVALMLFAGQDGMIDLPVARMTVGIFAVATLPLLAGMAVNSRSPRYAARLERVARPLATMVFAGIVVAAFSSQWAVMWSHVADVMIPSVVVNVAAMAVAGALGWGARLERRQRIAVVVETCLQNGALGIFVAATLLQSPRMMIPSIVYALVMNVTAVLFIALVRQRRKMLAV